jgi:mRNA-degrading endonuclease RelE of RelBE toxin-antitoxin system
MSAREVLEQVKALPPRERRKFSECVRDLETTIKSQPAGKSKRRIRWPDAATMRHRLFGEKVPPNLVPLAREQEALS